MAAPYSENPENTLLALLLALRGLETPLTPEEGNRLYEIGEQLEIDPDDWEFIQEGLMAIIADNPTLKNNFENCLGRLEALEDSQKAQLLPSVEELERINYAREELERRGYDPGEPDLESREIINTCIRSTIGVVKNENPPSAARELNWLERVRKILPFEDRSQSNQ